MRQTVLSAVALVTIASLPSQAQTHTLSQQDLFGQWSAECDAWGTQAHCSIVWAEGLHASHMTIHYRIASAANDATLFEGNGTYRQTEDTSLNGYWSDTQGAIHPLLAQWEDNALTTHWGVAGSTVGRTRYTLNDDGSLSVTDWQLTETGWAEFMATRYTRAGG